MRNTCIKKSYSVITKDKLAPPAATWKELEVIVLSEVKGGESEWFHLYVESKETKGSETKL